MNSCFKRVKDIIFYFFHNTYVHMKKRPVSHLLKNSPITIISNNCIGADICHSLGLRFNSPTVNLQIFPEDYIKFCKNLKHYLSWDILECSEFTPYQRQQIKKLYGGREAEELGFPFGICDDILIAFQHYSSFETAKKDWLRRRSRVDFSHCGLIMIVDGNYKKEAELFDSLNWKHKILLTINWSIQLPNTRTIHLELPAETHFMDYYGPFQKYYERSFDAVKWCANIAKD